MSEALEAKSYADWLDNFSKLGLIGKWFRLESISTFKKTIQDWMVFDGVDLDQALIVMLKDCLIYAEETDVPLCVIKERIKVLTNNGETDFEYIGDRKMV